MLAVCLFQFLMDKVIDQAVAVQATVDNTGQSACNSNKENQSACKHSDRETRQGELNF